MNVLNIHIVHVTITTNQAAEQSNPDYRTCSSSYRVWLQDSHIFLTCCIGFCDLGQVFIASGTENLYEAVLVSASSLGMTINRESGIMDTDFLPGYILSFMNLDVRTHKTFHASFFSLGNGRQGLKS